jgi:ABC-type sugar transport system permease subunit
MTSNIHKNLEANAECRLYAYRHAFTFSAFGYGCAMTFVLVLIGSVVSLLYWRVFRFTR